MLRERERERERETDFNIILTKPIFLQTNNDRYVFIPSASVSIATDAQFIQPNNPDQDPSERMANVSCIPERCT